MNRVDFYYHVLQTLHVSCFSAKLRDVGSKAGALAGFFLGIYGFLLVFLQPIFFLLNFSNFLLIDV